MQELAAVLFAQVVAAFPGRKGIVGLQLSSITSWVSKTNAVFHQSALLVTHALTSDSAQLFMDIQI